MKLLDCSTRLKRIVDYQRGIFCNIYILGFFNTSGILTCSLLHACMLVTIICGGRLEEEWPQDTHPPSAPILSPLPPSSLLFPLFQRSDLACCRPRRTALDCVS